MRNILLLFSLILLGTVFHSESILGKTSGEEEDKIHWEEKSPENKRSSLPIIGYIKDGSVTICLYESPTTVWISIFNISGDIVYECTYTDMHQETIDLSALESGSYEIVVEYGEKSFVGHFML